ncbi:MAG: vWA domain-containing protein, partial [Pseudomonadota bacterium]
MLSRPRRELEVLSVSALDLFASALGVFILLAILLFPYYLKQPSLDADIAAQAAEMIAAGNDLNSAEQAAKDAARRRAEARAARDEMIAEIDSLQSVLDDAELAAEAAAQRVSEVGDETADTEARLAALPVIDLDLVIVMDTTGSMRQEIRDIRANILGLVNILRRLSPSLRIGFVAYRDVGETYVTKEFPLSEMTEGNVLGLQGFLNTLGAKGGGDDPEDVR